MKKARDIGDFGEETAEKYLKKRFWRILSRNYLARGGEIDIIAFRFGMLVCFEVKTRSSLAFGTPASAVDEQKRSRIKKAFYDFSRTYIRSDKVEVFYPLGLVFKRRIFKKRIDILEVYLEEDKVKKINHLKDVEVI